MKLSLCFTICAVRLLRTSFLLSYPSHEFPNKKLFLIISNRITLRIFSWVVSSIAISSISLIWMTVVTISSSVPFFVPSSVIALHQKVLVYSAIAMRIGRRRDTSQNKYPVKELKPFFSVGWSFQQPL